MNTKIISVLFVSMLMFNCTSEFSDDAFLAEVPQTYDYHIMQGWSQFENGQYSSSVQSFYLAENIEATDPAVYLGKGWSNFRDGNLAVSRSALETAISFSFLDAVNGPMIALESRAGLAGISLASGRYADARTYVDQVLAVDPAFVFSYDNDVNYYKLKLVKATAAYYQGDYSEALQQMMDLNIQIDGVIHIDPANTPNAVAQASATTPVDGIAQVFVNPLHSLIHVSAVTFNSITYDIIDIEEGINQITVFGTPILSTGDSLAVEYYYTTDFGAFLADLLTF